MEKLRIAIQKSGRLSEQSLSLIGECGIRLPNGGGKLVAAAANYAAEILYLRDDDIPQYVAQGIADVGIIGENVLLESGKNMDVLMRLGFSACRLSLAVPRGVAYEGLQYFEGKRVATSYPRMLQQYLAANNVNAEIEVISGSVEIAPGIGLAEGICDIVSSGSTLLSNGLKEVETVLQSEAVLVCAGGLDAARQQVLDNLLFRLRAVLGARAYKYILLNAPDTQIPAITALLPGMKSPTVIPLAQAGWSSMHAVIAEDTFWDVIDKLKQAGAEGILIVPVEKMIL